MKTTITKNNSQLIGSKQSTYRFVSKIICSFLILSSLTTLATAQVRNVYQSHPQTLANSSWQYREAPPVKKIQLNDLVTVLINETATMLSEGEVDRRKTGQYESVITDWLNFKKGDLKNTPQRDGDPKVGGNTSQQFRSDSSLETRERVQFSMTCRVVGIRPNGNLVLFGRGHVHLYNEKFNTYVSGIVRPEDINSSNTVLSEKMAEKSIRKEQKGHVRDGWQRGWATRMIDVINPF